MTGGIRLAPQDVSGEEARGLSKRFAEPPAEEFENAAQGKALQHAARLRAACGYGVERFVGEGLDASQLRGRGVPVASRRCEERGITAQSLARGTRCGYRTQRWLKLSSLVTRGGRAARRFTAGKADAGTCEECPAAHASLSARCHVASHWAIGHVGEGAMTTARRPTPRPRARQDAAGRPRRAGGERGRSALPTQQASTSRQLAR